MSKNKQGPEGSDDKQCPSCGQRGRRVQPITVHSLLKKAARLRLNGEEDFLFCPTHECDVVYFSLQSRLLFRQSEVAVPVFQKSNDPARPVCYCFGFSVGQIEAEVQKYQASGVPDQITENCRQKLDRCPEKNPQGSCCLGNVLKVVKAAQGVPSQDTRLSSSEAPAGPSATGCCSSGSMTHEPEQCSREEA